MEWMILPLKRYADFSGRSRRKEYWMFFLFTIIVSVALGIIDAVLGLNFGSGFSSNGVLGSLFSLATLVPSLAVGIRRLHDTDRSGWWLLLVFLADHRLDRAARFLLHRRHTREQSVRRGPEVGTPGGRLRLTRLRGRAARL